MRKILLLLFILFSSIQLISQSKQDHKRAFVNGEFALLYEEYKEALPLFLELYNSGRKDANICHRIGLCYLNIANKKKESIPYLEEAVKDVTNNYRVGYYKEYQAPPEAFYHLGIAYRVNNRLDEAIEMFKKYHEYIDKNDSEKLKNVNAQLQACYNAKELKKTPTSLLESNLGNNINSPFNNVNPVVSADESVIIFVSELRFYDGIFYAVKRNNRWLPARNISLEFESENPLRPVDISSGGKTVYLVRNDNDIYNIYSSHFQDGRWTAVKPVSAINSRFNETHATISSDGNTIYFTSNRDGGAGEYDIYYAQKNDEGEWSEPINMGANINTPFEEATPFITEDGNRLYFSSKGHYNIGGHDIFYVDKQGETWSEPVNMGYPFNTTDDDIFFYPLGDGTVAYYSKYKETGYGENDIYRIQIFGRENIPQKEKELDIR